MHITKEATLSSKIEGTQTTVEEIFLKKQEISETGLKQIERIKTDFKPKH